LKLKDLAALCVLFSLLVYSVLSLVLSSSWGFQTTFSYAIPFLKLNGFEDTPVGYSSLSLLTSCLFYIFLWKFIPFSGSFDVPTTSFYEGDCKAWGGWVFSYFLFKEKNKKRLEITSLKIITIKIIIICTYFSY